MDSSTPTTRRRFGLRRRLFVAVLAVAVAATVFGTGHHGSKLALSASCGTTPVVPSTPPSSPTATSIDLSIPSAPATPMTVGSISAPASTPAATTPSATTPATSPSSRAFCKPGQTTPVSTTPGSAAPGTDTAGPTIAALSGTALRDGSIRGRKSLAFDAADPGSGVWQVEVTLGSTKVVPRRTVNSNHGRCDTIGSAAPVVVIPKDEDTPPTSTTPVAPSTPPTSTTPAKASGCKHRVHAKLPVDTKLVGNGPQFLTATLWDAAGNATVVLNQAVTVSNPAPPPAKIKTYTIRSVPNPADQLAAPDPAATAADAANAPEQAASTTKQSQATSGAPVGTAPTPPMISTDTILGRLEASMNTLGEARVPYCWGGGHQTTPAVPSSGSYCWIGVPAQRASVPDVVGLDCSSSVSWVLQSVGYPIPTMTSGEFANLGEPGPGKSLTIWANSTHVYLQVEIQGHSYFWGTSTENFEHGPNWHSPRSGAGFSARHLPGL